MTGAFTVMLAGESSLPGSWRGTSSNIAAISDNFSSTLVLPFLSYSVAIVRSHSDTAPNYGSSDNAFRATV